MAKKRGRQKTTPRIIARAKKTAEAIELRKSGATYAMIGAHFKISAQAAWDIVDVGLKAIRTEPAEQLKALELERIDHMLTSIWANATAAPPDGSPAQLDRTTLESIVAAQAATIRLMERRAKLVGLDAPVSQTFTGTLKQISAEPMTPEEWAAKHSGDEAETKA